jgi:nucleotide-binding universal stress UspA family protein
METGMEEHMDTTPGDRFLVVGVDASRTSQPALAWAVTEAASRQLRLHLVSAWNSEYAIETLGLAPEMVTEHCQGVLDAATEAVAAMDPSVRVSTAIYQGSAARALVAESSGADSLVVGSRGRRAIPAALIGATSLDVVTHAHCPVVVVRSALDPSRAEGPVVVGVEGSDASEAAIGYAFEHASSRRRPLTVVHAWQFEYVEGVIPARSSVDLNVTVSEETRALTEQTVARWSEKYPHVSVTTSVVAAHPVDALLDASKEASLLVVGSRGRGPIRAALLGSVGHGVLRAAGCPVAVVRPHRQQGA